MAGPMQDLIRALYADMLRHYSDQMAESVIKSVKTKNPIYVERESSALLSKSSNNSSKISSRYLRGEYLVAEQLRNLVRDERPAIDESKMLVGASTAFENLEKTRDEKYVAEIAGYVAHAIHDVVDKNRDLGKLDNLSTHVARWAEKLYDSDSNLGDFGRMLDGMLDTMVTVHAKIKV